MTPSKFNMWYNDRGLSVYVSLQAQRHANNQDDMDDFKQEAWARVFSLTSGCCIDQIHREVYNAIATAYQRELRHRKHEIPFSRMS